MEKMEETRKEIRIKEIKSVNNPNSVHGIFPYRGKISAIDAANVISEIGEGNPNEVLLDPFCGSGTILYEGFKQGMSVIGVDNNPLAIWLSNGKMALTDKEQINIDEELSKIIHKSKQLSGKRVKDSKLLEKAFHPDTLAEINSVIPMFEDMSSYMKAVFLGATALTARGCNNYLWTSNSVGKDIHPKRYINFFDKLSAKAKKHNHPLEQKPKQNYKIHHTDARNLSKILKKESVDYIFTSPPYFDGLDYTSYYGRISYELLGADVSGIRSGLIQKMSGYKENMEQVLSSLADVVKDDGKIIFVVGDKKTSEGVINGGDFFSELLHHDPAYVIERAYTGSTSKLFDSINKTKRKEQIVVWDKSNWK